MPKGAQAKLLSKIVKSMDYDVKHVAQICGVHTRTLFDWRREKYLMSYEALEKLLKFSKLATPKSIDILSDHWNIKNAAKLGAKRRNELHGALGTPEGRRKGGLISSLRFKLNPEYARRLGFTVRKYILYPQKSSILAEFIGIVLGDGAVTEYQVKISTNSKTDKLYAYYICSIVSALFGLTSTVSLRKKNAPEVVISSKNLVEFLAKYGLKKGNKIKQMTDVPKWIFKHKKFAKKCLRGLVDTDGGIYYHNHTTKGIKYRHMGLCYTSNSAPLLNSAEKMFLISGIKDIKNNKKNRLFLYGKEKVGKYLESVGSSNPKHLARYRDYIDSKTGI